MPAGIGYGGGGGSYDLGHAPNNAAVSKSRFSPGQVGAGLAGDGGFNINSLLDKAWWMKQQASEEDMDRQLRMDQAMRMRGASGQQPSQVQQQMPMRDMMQAKGVLDQMTPFNTAGGTNTGFRNMPAAASLTGNQLPQSGFNTYAMLAGAAPPVDPQAQAQARSLNAFTEGLKQDYPRSGTLADAQRFRTNQGGQ